MANSRLPSVEAISQLVLYNPETGIMTWAERPESMFSAVNGRTAGNCCAVWNAKYAGQKVGHVCKTHGYVSCKILGVSTAVHRIAWALHSGEWAVEVDHINGDRADNRLANLRSVTRVENMRNAKMRSDNPSGASGVGKLPSGRWRAAIRANGRRKHIGVFDSFEDAVSARKAAEKVLGFHPNHGRVLVTKELANGA